MFKIKKNVLMRAAPVSTGKEPRARTELGGSGGGFGGSATKPDWAVIPQAFALPVHWYKIVFVHSSVWALLQQEYVFRNQIVTNPHLRPPPTADRTLSLPSVINNFPSSTHYQLTILFPLVLSKINKSWAQWCWVLALSLCPDHNFSNPAFR